MSRNLKKITMLLAILGIIALGGIGVLYLGCLVCLDNDVTIINKTTQNAHVVTLLAADGAWLSKPGDEIKKWTMDLKPNDRQEINFVAPHDCHLVLHIEYEDQTTTNMLVNYYFTNGMGGRYQVELFAVWL